MTGFARLQVPEFAQSTTPAVLAAGGESSLNRQGALVTRVLVGTGGNDDTGSARAR